MPSETPANLRPDAFAGAADDYVRYRLPYPRALLDAFLGRANLPAKGARLIDLACGPGRVALAIADRFDEILAVDLEPEMVAAGEREAARLGIRHIRWSVGRAEDFEAPARAFDLVTCGSAFHRLDRPCIAAKVFGWLKPGGAFVTLGDGVIVADHPPWRRAFSEVVIRYVGVPAQRTGDKPNVSVAEAVAEEEATLRGAGFVGVRSESLDTPHVWTLPALLGYLRSTSVLSPHVLGARHAAFEADLTAALLAHDPSGRYAEDINAGYTIAFSPSP